MRHLSPSPILRICTCDILLGEVGSSPQDKDTFRPWGKPPLSLWISLVLHMRAANTAPSCPHPSSLPAPSLPRNASILPTPPHLETFLLMYLCPLPLHCQHTWSQCPHMQLPTIVLVALLRLPAVLTNATAPGISA